MHTVHVSGYPQDRENRENGENIFPAGKNQGISFCTAKFRENTGNFIWVIEIQGKFREFHFLKFTVCENEKPYMAEGTLGEAGGHFIQ